MKMTQFLKFLCGFKKSLGREGILSYLKKIVHTATHLRQKLSPNNLQSKAKIKSCDIALQFSYENSNVWAIEVIPTCVQSLQ